MAAPELRRDPVNEVYDRACELVEAAGAIRQLARSLEVAPAAPAILGCVETVLDHLADAAVDLERAVAAAALDAGRSDPRLPGRRRRMAHGLANLERGLRDARAVAAAARALSARVLERAG